MLLLLRISAACQYSLTISFLARSTRPSIQSVRWGTGLCLLSVAEPFIVQDLAVMPFSEARDFSVRASSS